MPDTKYFRTVLEVEVLSAGDDRPPADLGVMDFAYAIDNGTYQGAITRQDSWEVTAPHMAEMLKTHGAEPSILIVGHEETDDIVAGFLSLFTRSELLELLSKRRSELTELTMRLADEATKTEALETKDG